MTIYLDEYHPELRGEGMKPPTFDIPCESCGEAVTFEYRDFDEIGPQDISHMVWSSDCPGCGENMEVEDVQSLS